MYTRVGVEPTKTSSSVWSVFRSATGALGIGMAGFEPAAPWPQTSALPNCATFCQIKQVNVFLARTSQLVQRESLGDNWSKQGYIYLAQASRSQTQQTFQKS